MWLKDRLKYMTKRNCDLRLKFLLKIWVRAVRGGDDDLANHG